MSRRAVLFDLDGTLVDTAPDLIRCLHELMAEAGHRPLPERALQSTVSHGARMMVSYAFALPPQDPRAIDLESELVRRYHERLAAESRLFPGMAEVLAALERDHVAWGVVTNKPAALTQPLLQRLGLWERAGVVVSGDTLARAKPHPAPVEHAAAALGLRPGSCWAVGDARRDIQSAAAAGTPALVALFGYLHAGDRPAAWGAQGLLERPLDLLGWLDHERS